MGDPIRVLLVEDHTIVREGLRALLTARPDVVVVGEAEDGRQAIETARRLRPDVVVMDLAMRELNGVDATREIRRELPETQVVVLSMHSGEEHVRPAVRAGARGYLVKGSGLSDLVTAIRAVASGEAFFSPAVAAVLLDAEPGPSSGELSGREREVLQLVAEGCSSPEIAKRLHLSVKTVESHRSRIMSKLGASNVAGLVRHAIRLGLVDVE
jgi:DNA-binding NarL/FixJ family response regulator